MQRIMIVSDTHRRHGNLAEAIYNEGHLDMLIHLGDVEGEEEVIKSIAGCETIFIAGNNDFFSPLDREKEILEMKDAGKTKREIAEALGLEKEQIKDFLKRKRREAQKIAEGIIVNPQGRPSKYMSRNIVAEQAYEIRRLKMENELLRDFLSLTGKE